MSSNRVGGFDSPESKKDFKPRELDNKRLAPIEKIKAVDEAENEQTRKKFQRFLNEDSEEEPQTQAPSPFELSSYQTPSDDFKNATTPLQNYPKNPIDQISEPDHTDTALPQSQNFWAKQNTSQDHSVQSPSYKNKKETKEELFEKDLLQKEKITNPTAIDKTQKQDNKKNQTKPSSEDLTGPFIAPFEMEKNLKKKDKTEESSLEKKEKKLQESLLQQQSAHDIQKEKSTPDEKEDHNKKSTKTIELEPSILANMPPSIVQQVEATCYGSIPYINPQIEAVFFQMVGNIYIMNAKGVSTTEFTLNSPVFANSRFFGSTISIEKYATAPDSLNIRLSGPNQAVKAFNENLTDLYAAFQNGNFSFRIGRLTAEYSYEKPLFHRKEKAKDKDQGFSDQQGQR